MRASFFFIALGQFPFQTLAQSGQLVQRKDSVTVSAGIPKEQLALEDQLKAIIAKGNQAQ
jgi:hypothetical protein